MNTLINSIYESKGEVKLELVDMMTEEINSKQQLVLGDLRRVFVMIGSLLQETDKSIILSTHNLILALFLHLLQGEIENGMKIIQNNLIHNLADSDGQVRKSSKNIFQKFIQKTRNIEQILELLSSQFSNKDFYIRERTINLVPDILLGEKSVFSNRLGINEARKIVEALIIHTNDVNKSVKESSLKALRKIKNIENFDLVYRRLATDHQNMLDKIQQLLPTKVDKFIQLNLSCLKDEEVKVVDQNFVASEFLSRQCYKMEDFPYDLKTQLYFGFLRSEILQDTLNQKDLAIREKGILEMNQMFFNDFEEEISVNSEIVEQIANGGFMPAYFKYVSSLFNCQDFRVMNVLLNILSKIMQVPGIHVNAYLPLCLNGLIGCLQDERVVIRKRALFLLRQLVKYLKHKQYFQNLIYFLEQKMDNWHLKEELLNLISYLVLFIEPREDWFYPQNYEQPEIKQQQEQKQISQTFNLNQVNFQKALMRIAFFLDDPIAKVKYASLECLAVMSHCDRKHLDYLHEILDEEIYSKLVDKIENNIVYFINENGNLELPHINIKQLEEERQSYISQVSSIIIDEPPPKEQSESEESVKSNYKITYYYDKFPLSMKDKIKISNQSIGNLFASEHKQIETTKYDIVIPIDQYKQTKAKEEFHLVNSNFYYEKEQPKIVDYYQENSDEELQDKLEPIEFEYPTRTLRYRGHPPDQITQSKFQPIDDVKSRVYNTIKQLNEDINVDLQIPKVIKANVQAYQGYQFIEEQESDNEIFIDTKQIKKDHKIQINKQEKDYPTSQPTFQKQPEQLIENIQQTLINQQLIYTPEQKYQKRLDEFLLSFENRDSKPKARNARKLKRKLKEQSNQETITNILNFRVKIDNPRADTIALIVNLSALDLQLLQESLNKLQLLLTNHLDQVYASQANLLQIINDVCRLLSTQNDNPLYAIDYTIYPKCSPQQLVKEVVNNALITLSIAVKTLKTTLLHVPKMFREAGIWLQDENKTISSQAEQTLIDIVRFCDDSQLSDILPKLYDKTSFNSKIYVGVLLEHLILKHETKIFKSPHFIQIIDLISQMVVDISFDVRRQGKKIFFKMLTFGSYQVDDVIGQLHQQEKEQMKALLERYQELIEDHQIGVFDQEEYIKQQATPQNMFEIDDLNDMII